MTEHILVLADTHVATLAQLPARLSDLVRQADRVVHCGDFTSITVVEELHRLARHFTGVHGNTDEPEVKQQLPREAVLAVLGRRIVATHPYFGGPPWGLEEELAARYPTADAILYGHTHDAAVVTRNGILLLNPGQGYPNFFAQGTVGILKVTETEVTGRVFPLDVAEMF